jgi:hypothetical protein
LNLIISNFAKDPPLIPPYHPLFLKKIDFYYKRVIRGDEGRMCRSSLCGWAIPIAGGKA